MRKGKLYCICKGKDDGTPMVHCSVCKDWYHFKCVDLSERDAEDINLYVCPPCASKSGLRTVMDWEGPDAIDQSTPQPSPDPPSESDHDDPSSQDEYIAEKDKPKGKIGKRRIRRLSISSESSSSSHSNVKPSRRSPGPSGHLKRRQSTAQPPPAPKRRKPSADSGADDPARRYCLGKLQEVFDVIFTKYPHIDEEGDLTDDVKASLKEQARKFAAELEQCVYDIYSEPDKQGRSSAGGKYKERFRMLQFNLSKPDRVVLHQRIASSHITPKEISLMSSTDLANEETKQSIKIAEKEALEHSILQKTKVPRAKITHKGLQDIEDVNGEVQGLRDEREQEEEARRERERTARLRAAQAQQPQPSPAPPPESPVVPQTPTWGAPPALPAHVADHARPDFSMTEPELNLADLINIDEDAQVHDVAEAAPPALPDPPPVVLPIPAVAPASPVTTGISPFAAKSEPPARSSFDLNSLWTAPVPKPEAAVAAPPPPPPVVKHSFVDPEILGEAADDQDFDMFLEEKDQDGEGAGADNSPAALQAAFNSLPPVWTGMINMPLDSTIPQETRVAARQMGGRALGAESLLWKTLFPSELLRIDGRVPVDKSAQFLLQMRMNSTKELIGVAFAPGSEASRTGFNILTDFLIAKGRHGLVFPWGSRPKEHHPGRELYIIPLLSSDPVPDYMELLDDLRLPKIRLANYLIGIWVLNKGKLGPPPAAPASAPAPPASIPPPIPHLPTTFNPPAAAHPPAARHHPSAAPAGLAPITPATLAAEVASLTPEQIQMMIQTLTATGPMPMPLPQTHAPPAPAPPRPMAAPQAWQAPGPAPGYQIPYPANPGPQQAQPPPQSPYAAYERHDYPRPGPGPGYERGERGERGDRGWSRGRGKGRGRGRKEDEPRKALDAGWPRRHRGGEGGGGEGSSSPSRRWGESY